VQTRALGLRDTDAPGFTGSMDHVDEDRMACPRDVRDPIGELDGVVWRAAYHHLLERRTAEIDDVLVVMSMLRQGGPPIW